MSLSTVALSTSPTTRRFRQRVGITERFIDDIEVLRRRHEGRRAAVCHPIPDALPAVALVDRPEDGAGLERPEQEVVVLGDPRQVREHPIATGDAEVRQEIRDPVRSLREVGVCERGVCPVGGDVLEGGRRAVGVAVAGLVGDVEGRGRFPVGLRVEVREREVLDHLGVAAEVPDDVVRGRATPVTCMLYILWWRSREGRRNRSTNPAHLRAHPPPLWCKHTARHRRAVSPDARPKAERPAFLVKLFRGAVRSRSERTRQRKRFSARTGI